MPLWSVEEWRARIGSSWAALGRPVGCSSHCKQRRHYDVCCSLAGGGGGMVVSTIAIPMMTTVTLLMLSMSLIIVLPLEEAGCSPLLHTGSRMCYHGNTSSVWRHTSHLFLVLWNKLSSWSSSAKQPVGVLLPRDLFVSMDSVQPAGNVYIVSALAIAIVVTMGLETAAAVQASLLLRCGDIEPNPGPLGREDLEKVDNSYELTEDDIRDVCQAVVGIKSTYYQFGIALGLPVGELDSIRRAFHQLIDQAFDEVLLLWLRQRYDVERHGPPTWRRLVEAVDSPNGGNNHALAIRIANRHPVSGTSSKRVRLTQPPQPPLSTLLDRWRQILIDFYFTSHDLSDVWPPLKTVQFVQLALIQQKETARHIGLKTVKGDVDAIYGRKTTTDFFDLFMRLEYGSLYLLEGRPGSGKTTLMTYVSYQWAKGQILTAQSVKLVFLVQLRRLGGKDDVCLQDLLQVACSDFSDEDVPKILKYIIKNRGEGVVFALDGFDEYAPGQNPENYISKIIMKKEFQKCIVIVTSRPAATQPFRLIASKWIEVVGFLKEQVIQYVNCYFEQSEEEEKAQPLIKHLKEHPNLMNLCYLPLHCAMLVFLYEEDSVLPNTETEFYHDFTLSILIRSYRKQDEHTKLPPILRSFDHLPDEGSIIFANICKLAFKATVNSQQIFKQSELNDICFNNSVESSLGLVVIDRYFFKYGIDESYTFLHLTLQEYLAAVHIARLSESERTKVVSSHCREKSLHVTWRFLFGILDYSKESTANTFKLILDATRGNDFQSYHLLHVQCAYESHHSGACTDVLHFHENNLKFENTGPFDLACIIYVLKNAEYTTKMLRLSFTNSDFSVNDAETLLKVVDDHQLSLTIVWGKAAQSVLDALNLVTVPGLIEFGLSGGGGSGESVSMKNNLKHSINLKKLTLCSIDITNFELEKGFKYWPDLEELDIDSTNCPLTVLEAIKHYTNLVELTLDTCKLDASEAQVLGRSLKLTSKLHTIDLKGNTFADDGLQALSEGIKNCEDLKELRLSGNNLTDKSITLLTELIKSARNLENLELRVKQFTPEGKQKIKEAVTKRNSIGSTIELKLSV